MWIMFARYTVEPPITDLQKADNLQTADNLDAPEWLPHTANRSLPLKATTSESDHLWALNSSQFADSLVF